MESQQRDLTQLPIELGNGLTLRRSSTRDAEALSDFNARIHSDDGPDKPDEWVRSWTLDLLSGLHPTFNPDDFTIVEESATGKIVSALNLIPQTWTYAGIPFKVGRPELVGTLPEYRNRGLVRLQFDVVHRWSAERGEKLQAITGIPYYYRLFGYEMAMNLAGGRAGYPTHVPELKKDEREPFVIRGATEADIPFLTNLYKIGTQRSLVACVWDEALWRYELTGKSEKNVNREEVRIIETADGKACGFLLHPIFSWHDMMPIQWYEILPGFSWSDVTPSVIRYAKQAYEQSTPMYGEKQPFGAFGMWFGEDHPVYHAIPNSLPRQRKPYAWYLRLVDIPDFLHMIKTVLENRLEQSPVANFSGAFNITFYRDGLHLAFEKGKLTTIEPWKPTPVGHSGEAGFPPHTFLQLLFGYRTLDTLKDTYPDCWTTKDDVHVMLSTLFPRIPSDIWPVS